MNVSPKVAEGLRTHGHDAVHLREESLGRLGDAAVFRKAAAENRIVVTFDLDFGEVLALSQERWTSVILLRLRATAADTMVGRVVAAIDRTGPTLEAGATVIVEDRRIRTRRYPMEN